MVQQGINAIERSSIAQELQHQLLLLDDELCQARAQGITPESVPRSRASTFQVTDCYFPIGQEMGHLSFSGLDLFCAPNCFSRIPKPVFMNHSSFLKKKWNDMPPAFQSSGVQVPQCSRR